MNPRGALVMPLVLQTKYFRYVERLSRVAAQHSKTASTTSDEWSGRHRLDEVEASTSRFSVTTLSVSTDR